MGQILSKVDVSVIIVNYNSFQLLNETLSSLVEHTKGLTYEVIVVDNNSEGNVESVTQHYPDIKLIKNNINKGFAAANNQAVDIAIGDYLLFLNNDIKFIENAVKNVFEFAKNINEKVIIGIQLLNEDRSKQESVVDFPSVWNAFTENFFLYKIFKRSKLFNKYYQNEIELTKPTFVDVIRGAFMFCPKDEIVKLGGFDVRFFFYSEETDLCYRFRIYEGKVIFLPSIKIIHYGGGATDNDPWFKFKNQTIGKIQFYQKHFRGIRFITVILIHWLGLILRGIIFSISGILTINKKLFMKGIYFFKQVTVYPQNQFK